MKVILAEHAGFCFGVKRAVDMAYEAAKEENVYSYGPIIHNEEVVKDLENKGVTVLNSFNELEKLEDGKGLVILRSHGVGKSVYELLDRKNIRYVDTACPFVKKIHRLVSEAKDRVIIIGSATHPEVEAIMEWCNEEPVVLGDEEEAKVFSEDKNVHYRLVSQTTFNYKKFNNMVEILREKGYYIEVCNTICNATEERQSEAASLARKVDAMIVIGGRNSSNTQKLYDICSKECSKTYYIQTLVDLDPTILESAGSVGITAGASTPHNIIKEVHGNMAEEMNFEAMLEDSFKESNHIHAGSIVEGEVIGVKEDEIVLNINYKADGIIARNEYTNKPNVDLTKEVEIGQKLTAKVVKMNDGEGQVVMSCKRFAAEKSNEKLQAAFESQEVIKGKVVEVHDKGLIVGYEESRVFIPASLVSDQFERNLSKYQDQEIEFIITECNPGKRRIIGNRKTILEKVNAEKKAALFEKLEVGAVMDGVVKNVTDFGAFIDLGGADGLLHISEMSWGHVENPKKMFKPGQELKVLVKEIKEDKIALSLKFDDQNPWLTAGERYAKGTVVSGKVARMTDFGAFIELEPGIDGLLHVSQIALERVEKPADVLKKGDVVEAKVVEVKPEDRKISLSRKELLKGEATEEEVVEVDAADIEGAEVIDE